MPVPAEKIKVGVVLEVGPEGKPGTYRQRVVHVINDWIFYVTQIKDTGDKSYRDWEPNAGDVFTLSRRADRIV